MKKTLVLLTLIMITSLCSCKKKNDIEDNLDRHGYDILYFEDNFNDQDLNLNNWTYQEGTGQEYNLIDWGNSECEYYKKENVYIEKGNLILEAKKESFGNKDYTSGRIYSKGKIKTKYGRIEAKISLPAQQGLWPAFWMLPETDKYGNWPSSGEIDILEARGRIKDMTSSALHYGGSSDIMQTSTHIFRDEDFTSYHIYALEWEDECIAFYVDEDLVLKINKGKWFSQSDMENLSAPFDEEFYIILNLAVGGHFDNYILPENNFESAKMLIDYIRIYKKGEI